ncbi:hypothetical protein [Photobacterium damselae]|uniref:hypothetical protein n=1 Tax=Photobacterium damselae TaxID=38293 RepID=UPI004068A45B
MNLQDMSASQGIDSIIETVESQSKKIDPALFSNELTEARIKRETNRLKTAKESIHNDLSIIATFPDHYISSSKSVQYSEDSEWNIIKDLSRAASIKHDVVDLFKRTVSEFYDPNSYFPTITLTDNSLELNIEERSFILDLLEKSLQSNEIKDIIKNTEIIKDSRTNIAKLHNDTKDQIFLLRYLNDTLLEIDRSNGIHSSKYFIDNIDLFKKIYSDITSENDKQIYEGISAIESMAKSDPNDLSAVTAATSAFSLLYNEAATEQMRKDKISSVRAEKAKIIHERTKDINFDDLTKQFEKDESDIVAAMQAEKDGVNTKGLTEERLRREVIKNGQLAASKNPFALMAAQLRTGYTEPTEQDPEPTTTNDNIIRVKFR